MKTCAVQAGDILEYVIHFAMVVLANFILAAGVRFFLVPGGFIGGGATGLGLLLNRLMGWDLSVVVLVINVVMLILGLVFLGKQFALTTVVSTFLYPLALNVLDTLLPGVVLTDERVLCSVFAGALIGLAVGISFRAGASTGGLDAIALIWDKYFGVSAGVVMRIVDFSVIAVQVMYSDMESVLYGLITIFITSVVIDKVMLSGTTQTEVKIISGKSEEIRKAILSDVDRGLTMMEARGGYYGENCPVILSIVSNREVQKLKRLVYSIDPNCFMTISYVNEVRGRGFSFQAKYRRI